MLNTPPTFSWYIAGLVFAWLKRQGGVSRMGEINRRKSEKFYKAIDNSDFYRNPVNPEYRSWMNIPFTLPSEELDAPFLAEAEKAGLSELKGSPLRRRDAGQPLQRHAGSRGGRAHRIHE